MLKEIQVTGQKDTRSGFGDGIVEAARKNPNVVALTADLAGSMKLNQFMKEFPERYVQVGIAEANMIGIAVGLTIGGKNSLHYHLCQLLYRTRVRPDPSVSCIFWQERKDLCFSRRFNTG